jgi:hypothetical protein
MTAFIKAEADTALSALKHPQRQARGGARGASAPRQRDHVKDHPAPARRRRSPARPMDLTVAIGQTDGVCGGDAPPLGAFNQGAGVTRTLAAERRVSGRGDRRMFRRGGRRKDDQAMVECGLRVACHACGAWASIASFTKEGGQAVLCFTCPQCGHLEQRTSSVRPGRPEPGEGEAISGAHGHRAGEGHAGCAGVGSAIVIAPDRIPG